MLAGIQPQTLYLAPSVFLAGGLFRVTGSADSGLYAPGQMTGLAGAPDTNGYVLLADWTPLGKSASWVPPGPICVWG